MTPIRSVVGWRFLGTVVYGGMLGASVLPAADDPATDAINLESFEVLGERAEGLRWSPPAAVTDYTGEFLQANGIADYQDLAPLVPGLFVSEQSVDLVSLNLRGLTSDSSDTRALPRVSVFQDGVRLGDAHGNSVALFDLDDVAVFKGPQATLFGQPTASGALSLNSRRAANESAGSLTVGAGDYNASTAEVVFNQPVIADRLFMRVAAFSDQRDGYVENRADGSDLQGRGTLASRVSLRWQPTPATTADLIFNHQRDETPGIAFKTSQGVTGFPLITDTDPYSSANLNRGSELGVTRTITGLTGLVRHDVSDDWTLISTTAWREVSSGNKFDADGSELYLLELDERYKGRQLSQELRFDYDGGGRLTTSAGINVAWSKDRQTNGIGTDENTLFTFLTGGGVPPIPFNPRYYEQNTNQAETTSGDVFGRVDYKLTEKLTAGAGLRLTQERLVSHYRSDAAAIPGNLVGAVPTSGGSNNLFQNTNDDLTNASEELSLAGQVDARYAFTSRLTGFATVSRGRRPPVLDFDEITLADRARAEETVWNYEIGLKGATANRRVRYDASVFYYEFEHFQTQRTVGGVTGSFDGGRASGHGFELSVAADVTRQLTLFANYGFTDAEFASRDEDGQPQVFAGNSFRLTSNHVVSLGGTLSLPLADAGTIFVTPLFVYRSEYYFEDDNDQNGGSLRQGGFAVVNLRVGYRPRQGRWEVVGYVNNVFDKEYLLDAGNIGGTYGSPTTIRAAPRMAGVKATVRF